MCDRGQRGCELGPGLLWVPNAPSAPRTAVVREMKGVTSQRAAAAGCVNSHQELEEDEAGWVLSQKLSPLFLSFQLFIKAQCKRPDTCPAPPGRHDLRDLP